MTFGLFPVTENNLRAIVPSGRIILGELRLGNKELYRHVSDHVAHYVQLVKRKPAAFAVATVSSQAITLVNDFSEMSNDTLRLLIEACPPEVRIDDLTTVPQSTWSTVAGTRRTLASFANVAVYIEHGGVDSSLAALLKGRRIYVTQPTDRESRLEVAYAILAAHKVIPSTLARVQTVQSLNLGVLVPSKIPAEAGDLVARLIKAQLLPDDATAFSSTHMVDWDTMERAIKVSKAFKTFVAPGVLPVAWVPQLIQSSAVSKEQRLAVIQQLESYLTTATPAQAREIASSLIRGGWRIRSSRILALKAAGATSGQIIILIANHGDDLELEQVRQILGTLGGQYARVANGGSGRPSFANDSAHRKVLERFVGDTVQRVKEEHFKRLGVRLVARLK